TARRHLLSARSVSGRGPGSCIPRLVIRRGRQPSSSRVRWPIPTPRDGPHGDAPRLAPAGAFDTDERRNFRRSHPMSDAEHEGQELPRHDDQQTGVLRRAMEQRVKQLQDAEDRIRREQSALQEQAKVVFAEREARLARRERELAKREAALAVSEGIAAGVPAERDKDLEEREHALAAREEALEQ